MKAHSPVATADSSTTDQATGAAAASEAAAGVLMAAAGAVAEGRAAAQTDTAAAARQVRAAALQTSHLQSMVEEANGRVARLSEELKAARAAGEQRDVELRRLQVRACSRV